LLHRPPHVGDLRWPVISAARVGTADEPAEFVVIADCGKPTPRERYATFRVFQWAQRSKAEQGEYDLTFDQARHSLAERAGLLPAATKVEVVVVRDPDAANDYTIFVDGQRRPDGATDRVHVITHDIDLGAAEITPTWVAEQLRWASETLSPAARRHAHEAVTSYADDLDPRDGEALA
jgi:hypothetical protein